MKRPTILATAPLALALAFAAPTAAQGPDYSGTWHLDSFAQLPNDGGTCTFTGRVTLTQEGDALSGDAVQFLVEGPMLCPPTMMAALGGQVGPDGCVTLGTLMGPLGEAAFVGCPGDAVGTLEGDWTVASGPFAGGSGTWSAVLLPSALEVPSLSTVGLVALGLLLLTSAFWMLRRRTAGGGPPAALG